MPAKARILDLFCGAGGFSLGAHKAGFDVAASIDIDATLTSSYSHNFPETRIIREDIATLRPRDIEEKTELKLSQIIGIIGGPPCQGFSTIGKRAHSDPRNELIGHYFRIVKAVQPSFFVMENVPGLMSLDTGRTLTDALDSLKGFTIIGPMIVDACDYGAATHRRRVLVIGYDAGKMLPLKESDFLAMRKKVSYTVRDAISDIPEPTEDEWSEYRSVCDISSYAKRARRVPREKIGSPEYKRLARLKKISGLQPTKHSNAVLKRFSRVQPGESDTVSRCPRLQWKAAAPTLRAGTGPENGSFQSIRPIHPEADRVITVREAARLQGFPDWFGFHATKWHSFRMIGNSVSPILAASVLKAISAKLA